jgi:hypothetical protein
MAPGPDDIPIRDYAINIGVALVGAAVRFLRQWNDNFDDWRARRIFFEGLLSGVTAGFVGVLTFWLLTSWKVDAFYTAFAVGIMGHMGPEGIALLKDFITNALRLRSQTPEK